MTLSIYLQRTVLSLLLPPAGPLLLIVVGLLVARSRGRRTGRTMAAAGLLLLYLLSLSPVSSLLLRPLEMQYPPLRRATADAVVVLTASARDRSFIGLAPVPDDSSLTRLMEGVRLYRGLSRDVPFIICGGRGDPAKTELSLGAVVARTATAEFGIPEERLLVEDASTNTREGAEHLAALFEERSGGPGRIILVTSAFHLGRAVTFFEEAGFAVLPAPTDFQSETIRPGFQAFIPRAEALRASATAFYEYLARLRYLNF